MISESAKPLLGVLIGIGVGLALYVGTDNMGVGIGVGVGLAIIFGGGAALLGRAKHQK